MLLYECSACGLSFSSVNKIMPGLVKIWLEVENDTILHYVEVGGCWSNYSHAYLDQISQPHFQFVCLPFHYSLNSDFCFCPFISIVHLCWDFDSVCCLKKMQINICLKRNKFLIKCHLFWYSISGYLSFHKFGLVFLFT